MIASARALIARALAPYVAAWVAGEAVPPAVGDAFALADAGNGAVCGRYNAAESDLAGAIESGLIDPDSADSCDQALATLRSQLDRWNESARLRRVAPNAFVDVPTPERQVIRSRWRAGSGYRDPKAYLCTEPVTGSVGLSPDDPRSWSGRSGLESGLTAMIYRARANLARERNRVAYAPKRRVFEVSGYASQAGAYHARSVGKRKR